VVEGTQLQFWSKRSQLENAEEVDTEGREDQLRIFESGSMVFLSRGFREQTSIFHLVPKHVHPGRLKSL
jgi:hypothetical protein